MTRIGHVRRLFGDAVQKIPRGLKGRVELQRFSQHRLRFFRASSPQERLGKIQSHEDQCGIDRERPVPEADGLIQIAMLNPICSERGGDGGLSRVHSPGLFV